MSSAKFPEILLEISFCPEDWQAPPNGRLRSLLTGHIDETTITAPNRRAGKSDLDSN